MFQWYFLAFLGTMVLCSRWCLIFLWLKKKITEWDYKCRCVSVPRNSFLKSLYFWFLFKSFKHVFSCWVAKNFYFPLSYMLKMYGHSISINWIAYSFFAENFICKHDCLVQFYCKLTYHKMHCWYAFWCVFVW